MIFRFVALLTFVSPVCAQIVGGEAKSLRRWDGDASFQELGEAFAGAGDVNGDGFDDILIGDRWRSPAGNLNAGSAYVYSGLDGTMLYQWDGAQIWDSLGKSVAAAGDVNLDGFSDLLVSAPDADPSAIDDAGSVFLYSGASGQVLLQLDGTAENDFFGYSVSSAGDLNADGIPDILVGAPFTDFAGFWSGSAYAYSGFDGSLLHQWDGTVNKGRFGYQVAPAGDIDGDGFDDVLIMSPQWPSYPQLSGKVFLYSGNSGNLIYSWFGIGNDNLGSSMASVGDLNDDGIGDILIGASWNATQQGGSGSAFLYSGADGSLLTQWDSDEWRSNFGISVSAAGDMDHDGVQDVLIGSIGDSLNGVVGAGSAHFFSGKSYELLHRWDGIQYLGAFGKRLAYAGDTNADGLPDYLIGSPSGKTARNQWGGLISLLTFSPFLQADAMSISASTGGTIQLDLDFPDAAAFDEYKVLISATGLGLSTYGVDIPLSRDNLVDHTFLGNYPMPVSNMHGVLDAAGNASASFTAPAGFNPQLVGRTFYLAAIANQPGQLPEYSSVAVAIEITP